MTSSAYSKSPHRETAGQPRDPQSHRLDHACQVGGGGLALQIGVRGQDQFGDRSVGETGKQLANPQVVGAHALNGADGPAEHVVAAPELAGPLDRDDILRLLHHADDRLVAARVAADVALLLLRDIAAHRAEADLVLHLEEGVCEASDVGRLGLQDVEGDPLRALGTDAGQPAQFVDEVLNHAFVQRNASPGLL